MRCKHKAAGLILLFFVALASLCGIVIPPFENLDEIEHFGAIRYIADTGRLPAHRIPAAEEYHYRQEASQPPLYYLLSAGLVRLLGLDTGDMPPLRFNPRVICGPDTVNLYDNRAILYHDPNREAFPWHGALLVLHTLRIWSTLLQGITVVGTYALGCLLFPKRPEVALLGMAVVAFNPQFLLVASGVNNDNLVTPLATVALYVLLRNWRDGFLTRRALALGLLIGLAGLAKLSGWVLLILIGALILFQAVRKARESRGQRSSGLAGHALFAMHHFLMVLLPALAVSGWWFWRNWRLYGDLTALKPMLALVGERGSPIYPLLETALVFRSFWGQISCSFYPAGFYAFYIGLTILALSGLAWGWRRLEQAEKAATTILLGWFVLIVISWARWDALTPAPGGRLLFPALPALGLVFALGLDGWLECRQVCKSASLRVRRVLLPVCVVALLVMALWSVLGILPGFFAPPPRYADAHAIHPQHPLDATLGESVRLSGYDVELENRGPTLDVTLYWQALASLDEDYIMALQLVSPVPGDTILRLNYNSWPGHGNYPTTAWRLGQVIADRYRLRLPAADFPTQAWDLHLALYQERTGDRLPFRVGGVAIGDHLVLTRLRVPGHPPDCPEEGRLTSEVRFDTYARLTHAWIAFNPEDVRVMLCWKALASLPGDYTVFVHALDDAGALVGSGDGPPMQGAFPTSLWQPGDMILDIHRLATKEDMVPAHLTVGLYTLADGSRLPAFVDGILIPEAEVTVWTQYP